MSWYHENKAHRGYPQYKSHRSILLGLMTGHYIANALALLVVFGFLKYKKYLKNHFLHQGAKKFRVGHA